MGKGLFILFVNTTVDSMYGYCTSQDEHGNIVFGKWVFAKNNGFDEQVSARLHRAERYLEESTIGPASEAKADKIKIDSPEPFGELSDRKSMSGGGYSYLVQGSLPALPEFHEIWLLTADGYAREYWPQGFHAVQYNAQTGKWRGRVKIETSPVTICVVVAPPTSQDALLGSWQDVGSEEVGRHLSK